MKGARQRTMVSIEVIKAPAVEGSEAYVEGMAGALHHQETKKGPQLHE